MHITDEMKAFLPLRYEDGPDYCTVTDKDGGSFALTVRPDAMKAMEQAALLAALAPVEPVAWLCEGEKPGYWREGKHVIFDAELAAKRIEQPEWWKVIPLYTSPSTPSEDDLVAALERIRKLSAASSSSSDHARLHKALDALDQARIIANNALIAIRNERSRPPALPVVGEALTEFGKHRNWELSCGEDPQMEGEMRWHVHAVNGGRNDREWTLIGFGETPGDAIRAAIRNERAGGKADG